MFIISVAYRPGFTLKVSTAVKLSPTASPDSPAVKQASPTASPDSHAVKPRFSEDPQPIVVYLMHATTYSKERKKVT